MNKTIIIARNKSEAARYAQSNGIDGFYHVSNPGELLGIERGSSYFVTPEFEHSVSNSYRLGFNEMISKRGLVRL